MSIMSREIGNQCCRFHWIFGFFLDWKLFAVYWDRVVCCSARRPILVTLWIQFSDLGAPHRPDIIFDGSPALCWCRDLGRLGNHWWVHPSSLRRRFPLLRWLIHPSLKSLSLTIFVLWFGSGHNTAILTGDGDLRLRRLW